MIYILPRDLSFYKTIPAVKSILWREAYNEIGTFTLVVGDTDYNAGLLKKDYIVYYKGNAGIIQKLTYANGEIIVNGSALSQLLNQRILLGNTIIGVVETSLYNAWNANARGMDVETDTLKGLEDAYNIITYGNSFGAISQTVCKYADLGFRIRIDLENKKKIFEIYKGKDRTDPLDPKSVTFSTARTDMSGAQISDDDSSFCNVVVVYGTDVDGNRIIETVWNDTSESTGRERRELGLDLTEYKQEKGGNVYDDHGNVVGRVPAESIEAYRQRLRTEGLNKLRERCVRRNFNVAINGKDYGSRYNLGDMVRCNAPKYGIHITARISGVTYSTDRNKDSIILTLGEPKISMKDMVNIWRK